MKERRTFFCAKVTCREKFKGHGFRVSSYVIFFIFLTNTKIIQATLHNPTGLHRKCKLDDFQTRLVSVTVLWTETNICHFLFSLITLIRSDLVASHVSDCVIDKIVLHNCLISQNKHRIKIRHQIVSKGWSISGSFLTLL
jgi:hypothetical protein